MTQFMSEEVRRRLRQILADSLDEPLFDAGNPDTPTVPTRMKPPDADRMGSGIRTGVNLGNALVTSISAKNPGIFAELAAKQLMSKTLGNTKKQAELIEEWKRPTSAKIASSRRDRALDVLQRDPPVSVVLLCLLAVFGEDYKGFEPETIFWDLEDFGVSVDENLKNKINCGLVLAMQPAFYNDFTVFENSIRAMNGLDVDVDIVQKPDIPYICAGIYEADRIMSREQDVTDNDEFDDEIDIYVARALQHDNYILAPAELSFVQDLLDKYNVNSHTILPELKKAWTSYQEELVKENPRELEENILDVQLGKLAGCWLYVKEREDEVAAFTSALEEA